MAQTKPKIGNKKRALEASEEPPMKKKKLTSLNGHNKNENNDEDNEDVKNIETEENTKETKKNKQKEKVKENGKEKVKENGKEKEKEKVKDNVKDKAKNKIKNKVEEKEKETQKEETETKNDKWSWDNINVSADTRKAIDKLGFERMMEIQAKAIPPILEGKHLAGAAKTGSGKTLAFIIPAVESLARCNWDRSMGTGVFIIAPTRELAIQIKGVGQTIAQFHRNLRVSMCIGGASRNSECQMLKMGCSIVVATPGRLSDHLNNTPFRFDQLKMLIIDEADYILDIGFEHQMYEILQAIPKTRQTLLFSATLTEKTKDLVTMAFDEKPVFIRATGEENGPTADKLSQMYTIIPQDKKLPALLTFFRQHRDEKILCFFSTKSGTKFYEYLFNSIGLRVMGLYGAMTQDRRTNTFFQFVEAKSGILVATNVASRGLDFPSVHWIVQFDPPIDPKEYIHRVGRTARAGLKGEAISFLQPSELAYLELLKECGLELKKIEIENVPDDLQANIDATVEQNYELTKAAKEACRVFCRSYDQRANSVFDNNGVNRQEAARSFCLQEYPRDSEGYNRNGDSENRGGFKNRGFGNRGNRGGFKNRGDKFNNHDESNGFGRNRGRGGFRNRGRGQFREGF